ncbi:hypothetical protein PsorP6_012983 [Peronosclerospora sorghi]|uniref:Uncharacterized protein n=1 Tax=Peronosclerospora sorghi TaxID=230839 RepID=A0ACC0WGM1_9STRA|nr:hypothetical protein PsorP6_012983 [Peronosclerospora sorghi]
MPSAPPKKSRPEKSARPDKTPTPTKPPGQDTSRADKPPSPDKPVATPTPPPHEPATTVAPTPRRPPPPRRFVPNDSLFTASCLLISDSSSSNDERYFKASSQLPTPVSAADSTRMWIPAPQLATEHSIDEILKSLAGDAQPETWRYFVPLYLGRGSILARQTKLTICGISVAIRGYSRYDKLYYVDLTRLPQDVPDRAIYNWLVANEALPVLITPTYVAGGLKSRDRTVYFSSMNCPAGVILPSGEPLREIYFDSNEKPCFVQHRLRKYNRVTAQSLRQRPPSPKKDKEVTTDDASMGEEPVPLSHTDLSPSDDAMMDGPSTQDVPLGSILQPQAPRVHIELSPSDDAMVDGPTPHDKPLGSVLQASSGSHPTDIPSTAPCVHTKRLILDSVPSSEPSWQLVQASRRGITQAAGPVGQPVGMIPCSLVEDAADPTTLTCHTMVEVSNTYEVLTDYAYGEAQPPYVDIAVYDD